MSITIFPRAARAALLAALLACAFALYAAASADAAIKPGTYRGKSEQGAVVSLKVLSSKKALIKFSWEGAAMGCSDNQVRQIEGGTTGSTQKIKLSKSGRFEFGAQLGDAAEFATAGRVNGNRATGALQVQARVNEAGELDPAGAITCDSEIVEYTLKRR
jgi:hypothetical protein